MDNLFLQTDRGNLPLSPETIKKYNIKKGNKSPFLRYPVVDRFGDATAEPPKKSPPVVEESSLTLTTSEIIDFMQGADSSDA